MKMHSQIWLDTKIAKGVMVLQFRKVKELCVHSLQTKELRTFANDCNFGKKFAATTQSFWKVLKLPIFVFEHATHMVCLSVTLVCRQGLNLTACSGHVMFSSQQPSDCDFLRGVCLHCRYDLLKAKGLSVNFGNRTTSSDVHLQRCALLHNV